MKRADRSGTLSGQFRGLSPKYLPALFYVCSAVYAVSVSPLVAQDFTSVGLAPDEELGLVEAVVFDSRGRIFVLDGFQKQVVALDVEVGLVGKAGRTGRGPGELMNPVSMAIDGGDMLHVLDPGTGRISLFTTEAGDPEFYDSIPLGFAALYDLCVTGTTTWVLGLLEDKILHEIDSRGEIVRSMAAPAEYSEHPRIALATAGGLLRCAGDAPDMLVVGSEPHGTVRAFTALGEEEVWSTTLPDFVKIDIELLPGDAVRFSRESGAFYHWVVSLGVLNGEEIWVQYGRIDDDVRRPEEIIDVETVIISSVDGSILRTPEWPRVDHLDGAYALGIDNRMIPHVRRFVREELR